MKNKKKFVEFADPKGKEGEILKTISNRHRFIKSLRDLLPIRKDACIVSSLVCLTPTYFYVSLFLGGRREAIQGRMSNYHR